MAEQEKEDKAIPETYRLEEELDFLDAKELRLTYDNFEDLTLELKSKVQNRVTAFRAFPISSRRHFVLLRDAKGAEIGIIRDTRELEPDSRQALREELEHAYFTPQIAMVNSIEDNYHVPHWDVVTNRGPREFDLRSVRDMRDMGNGRLLIRDADGNRYEIPDYRKLDPVSVAIVETQL